MAGSEMTDMASISDTASLPDEEQQTLDLVHQLLRSFQNGQSSVVFAVGGTIPIRVANNTVEQSTHTADGAKTSQPVILHWDPSSPSVPAADCKLQFPLDLSDSKTVHNMRQLLHDMQPATFGYQGQNILDESYRRASKLDPANFTCNFSPYDLGIINDVARVLLPGIKDQTDTAERIFCVPDTERVEPRREMRAELYKLNVYAGPSGHFKAHVDTPRSAEQIGSLVVCLPCVHSGGQLEVRHEGRTTTFDWSMPEAARPEIQWAAFYSDCEHQVLEVTSGHRITLTYNLYASTVTSTQQVGKGVIDPVQMPLYGILRPLFLQENFMPDGGYVGAYTSHAYPHTSSSAQLPSTLKGADMVVWETLRSLGCGVRLRPVVELPEWAHYGHEYEGPCPARDRTDTSSEGCRSFSDNEDLRFPDSLPAHYDTDWEPEPVEEEPDEYDEDGRPMTEIASPSAHDFGHSVAGSEDVPTLDEQDAGDQTMEEALPALPIGPERWQVDPDELQALQQEAKEIKALPRSELKGPEPPVLLVPRHGEDKDEEATEAKFELIGQRSGCRVLGNGLSFHPNLALLEDNADMDRLLNRWMKQKPHRQERTAEQPERVLWEDVAWLNHPGAFKEPQINFGICGNEAEASIMYSTCGIVAQVPAYTARKAHLGKEESTEPDMEAGTKQG